MEATGTIPGKKRISDRIGYRIFICFLTLILLILITLFGAMGMISYGPSPSARDLFVVSVMETSAAKFLARVYFGADKVQDILAANAVVEVEEISDGEMIVVPAVIPSTEEDLVVEDILGSTFRAKMMIIRDPSRLLVGVAHERYSSDLKGKTVNEIVARYGAAAGVNAGGFVDENGKGDGSLPLGIVISQGEMKWGSNGTTYEIIGFDQDNKLVIGKMTGKEAMDRGIRDAVSFGPMLIVNGEAMEVKGAGSGLNPRTAIGQRADGAILLLTIDGRQPNSLGGTLGDVMDIMLRYEAVNAANLDGGSSTVMILDGALINVCCSLYGPRAMPNAIVVR
ncbi:MAG: phosphodiester glycosidase family protein [Clostridiales bacterium]|nr:phosphodiester glycosidase family protein [Clostridiales bacterium]